MAAEAYRAEIRIPSDRIIVALDNMDWTQASETMDKVGRYVGMGKANSIAQKLGWLHAVDRLAHLGVRTMADAKFHDIPETVRLQVKEVTESGASLITVHASGGEAMLKKAVEGREEGKKNINQNLPITLRNPEVLGGILGITVLTSLDEEECVSIYGDTPERKVTEFARMALDAGVDGIVCSPKELKAIRAISALDSLVTVVPGITPLWAKKPGDQKRVSTPIEALRDGADFEVIGRAITQPPEGMSQAGAARIIADELAEVS
ncbi:MAG TPA: orotidine-5'-phosphate decarboxylase [Candidatus Saccharimonadales bacterium]|nr:orotidine-5'-phosphate decarboxylase [Candidatus Saccharimonadales bacterium]